MRGRRNERLAVLIVAAGLPVALSAAAVARDDPFPASFRAGQLRDDVGATIHGAVAGEATGWEVRPAGDVNDDGLDDVVINNADSAVEYVLFGRADGFGSDFSLADLNGQNGFVLRRPASAELFTNASGAGDVNGDGIDDIIVGDWEASPGGVRAAGRAYVVFGRSGPFPAEVELAALDGSDGFAIVGEAIDDRTGAAVAAVGDVNGDGIDDVAMTAFGSRCCGSLSKALVVFGSRDGFDATFEVSTLDGANGFRIVGPDAGETFRTIAGAGDINGDGLGDLVIGNKNADPRGRLIAGSAFVLFGTEDNLGPQFDLAMLDGRNGFRVNGAESGDQLGRSVASAGDVNGDGFDDLVLGAEGAGPGRDGYNAGRTYVLFGKDAGFEPVVDLAGLGGEDGFRIDGASDEASSGRTVGSAGDINGDGFDDTLVGAPSTGWRIISYYPYETRSPDGEAFVIFGRGDGFPDVIPLDDLTVDQGLRIEGTSESHLGNSVARAGDVNGDGNDDLIIGEYLADPTGLPNSGASYILYGRDLTPCEADLDGDGALTVFDFLGFQIFFDLMDPRADFDGDGDFTIFDFLAFQNAFDAGCP